MFGYYVLENLEQRMLGTLKDRWICKNGAFILGNMGCKRPDEDRRRTRID